MRKTPSVNLWLPKHIYVYTHKHRHIYMHTHRTQTYAHTQIHHTYHTCIHIPTYMHTHIQTQIERGKERFLNTLSARSTRGIVFPNSTIQASEATAANWSKGASLPLELETDLDTNSMTTVLQACRMEELGGQRSFHTDLKGQLGSQATRRKGKVSADNPRHLTIRQKARS